MLRERTIHFCVYFELNRPAHLSIKYSQEADSLIMIEVTETVKIFCRY